jgi:hypothetical protein
MIFDKKMSRYEVPPMFGALHTVTLRSVGQPGLCAAWRSCNAGWRDAVLWLASVERQAVTDWLAGRQVPTAEQALAILAFMRER